MPRTEINQDKEDPTPAQRQWVVTLSVFSVAITSVGCAYFDLPFIIAAFVSVAPPAWFVGVILFGLSLTVGLVVYGAGILVARKCNVDPNDNPLPPTSNTEQRRQQNPPNDQSQRPQLPRPPKPLLEHCANRPQDDSINQPPDEKSDLPLTRSESPLASD